MNRSKNLIVGVLLSTLMAACGGGGGDAETPAAGPGASTAGNTPVGGTTADGNLVIEYRYPTNQHIDVFAPVNLVPTVNGVGNRVMQFTLTSGSLPAGVTLNSSTGVISGVATVPGIYVTNIALSVAGYSNSLNGGPGFSITTPFRIQYGATASGHRFVLTRGVAITPITPQIIGMQAGDTGSFSVRDVNNAAAAALPSGLMIDATTGAISGTVSSSVAPSASAGSIDRTIVMTVTRGSLSTEVRYGGLSFYIQ